MLLMQECLPSYFALLCQERSVADYEKSSDLAGCCCLSLCEFISLQSFKEDVCVLNSWKLNGPPSSKTAGFAGNSFTADRPGSSIRIPSLDSSGLKKCGWIQMSFHVGLTCFRFTAFTRSLWYQRHAKTTVKPKIHIPAIAEMAAIPTIKFRLIAPLSGWLELVADVDALVRLFVV